MDRLPGQEMIPSFFCIHPIHGIMEAAELVWNSNREHEVLSY